MAPHRFEDRHVAGHVLGRELRRLGYGDRSDVIVLALPRGGVPVAYEVATSLHAPLDVFLVRKLGVPGQEELAMGAIAAGGITVMNHDIIDALDIPQSAISRSVASQQTILQQQEEAYRGNRSAADVRGRTVILIDDGLATGASMRAAVTALRQSKPARIVVAVPVAAAETRDALAKEADAVVCLMTPSSFRAVGQWYQEFTQTSDAEVQELLARAMPPVSGASPATSPPQDRGT